jgi:4-hydroxybenzoate polyprenyltransferase
MEVISSALGERDRDDAGHDPLYRKSRPLVIDVDEILSRSNLFVEAVFSEIVHSVPAAFALLVAILQGKSRLKQKIARSSHFDASRLLFDQEMVTFLLQVMAEGRPVYLSSGKYHEPLVRAVAQHLGVFTAWSASFAAAEPGMYAGNLPHDLNQGFDYLGHDTIELPHSASRVARSLSHDKSTKVDGRTRARTWAKLLRVHQYAKNALVLVPLLTAHQFALLPAAKAVFAAIAFSLCASGAYILNDLIDVKADRTHPSKRHRPIASGAILPAHAAIAMALVLAGAVAIASSISLAFLGVLLGYLALTTTYSFWLKRIAVADVVALAMLYTIRVIGGAVAVSVTMSEWLFAFSLFMFMSLALVKRYVELAGRRDGDRLMARDYQADDKSMVAILAAAAGFNSVVIFTLYISSETVRALYTHPQLLWIDCPILMYWIARVMLLAQRGLIDDDPVIFALGDRVSWLALGTIGSIMLAAI